ncbi:hypothetical protein [Kyrpidia sp.]|uniref:hypothetical protein n=1 Tax=Kyrpidia sp. TaxID=2073077 RepID=UPI002586C6EC|nr:hypothetical protein [Kyrpidia sp.]MCL6576919.1 hypothetical protein [Kyrpidia sp.]
MIGSNPNDLVKVLRGGGLMCRTGILLIPTHILGRETSIAAEYNLDSLDYVSWKEKYLLPGGRFLGLNSEKLLGDMDRLLQEPSHTDALLIYNLDLALAYLSYRERNSFWRFMRTNFRKRPKSLVLALPSTATKLLPYDEERVIWYKEGRLAIFEEFGRAT